MIDQLEEDYDLDGSKQVSHHTNGGERRAPFSGLSEDDVEELVGRVTQKVLDKCYQDIGRSVVNKALWVIGLVSVSLLIWLAGAGKLKIFQ
jgi:hypothetical protein